MLAHPFDIADCEVLIRYALRCCGNVGAVRQREERPRVTDGETPCADHVAHRVRERSQAEQVGDCRAVLSNRGGDLLLCEVELLLKAMVAVRFLDRIAAT